MTRKRYVAISLVIIIVLGGNFPGFASEPEKNAKRIFLLFSDSRGLPVYDILEKSIRAKFDADSNEALELYIEYLDRSRFHDDLAYQKLLDLYHHRYSNLKFDLVIAVQDNAFDFLANEGDALFPGVPMVFMKPDRKGVKSNMTGVTTEVDVETALNTALTIQPTTRHIVVIYGNSENGRRDGAMVREVLDTYADRLDVTYLTDLPMEEILRKVSRLPKDTIIFALSFYRDSTGRTFIPLQVMSRICQVANAPVYTFWAQTLGHGTIGGYMVSFEAAGTRTAELGLRILDGEDPKDIPLSSKGSNVHIFDWRQLKKWGIRERDLPPDSIVRYKEFSVWDLYKWYIIGAIAFAVFETALIVGLLIQRRKRYHAEHALKQSYHQLEQRVEERTAELATAKEAAEASNRAKSTFLSNMSHEFRTPLNAMLGFAQLMERDPTFPEKNRENLGILSRSGDHLLELINDVLEMSKIEVGRSRLEFRGFNLYRMLDDLVEMIRIRAEKKGLALTFSCDANVPEYINTDQRKLRQILLNLLGNAVKFTREGGVSLRVHELDELDELDAFSEVDNSETQKLRNSTTLRFEIEDTGPGIPQERFESIFEPFAQFSPNQSLHDGTGLGLTISRQFIHLLGGDISVSSDLGRGTTFIFEIHVEEIDRSVIDKPQSTISKRVIGLAPDQPAYRILIAEDSFESRTFLRQLLESVGFTVQEATNGQQAVERCQDWQPDLIWMDMRMPVLDGYEATKSIRELTTCHPVIIALTASAFKEDRDNVLAAGCDDFVRKPYQEADIFDQMAKHLGVRYLYQETTQPVNPGFTSSETLPAMDLENLPVDWVKNLREAARRGRSQPILQLAEEIRPERARLADVLTHFVRDFQIERIAVLTEKMSVSPINKENVDEKCSG